MIAAAFILGVLGSWHCLGMCGPIAMIIPGSQGKNRIYSLLLYNLGKIITYVIIGFLFGLFGVFLSSLKVQSAITIGIGALMLLFAFTPWVMNQMEKKGYKLFSSYFKFKSKMAQLLKKDSFYFSFVIGLLNGFIPCGLVYTAAIASMAQANAFDSAIFMMAFGLGTAPFLSLLIFLSEYLKNGLRKRAVLLRTAAFLLVGVFMIWKGVASYQIQIEQPSTSSTEVSQPPPCHAH